MDVLFLMRNDGRVILISVKRDFIIGISFEHFLKENPYTSELKITYFSNRMV